MRGVYQPLKDRLMARVRRDKDCWIWTGAVSDGGYGRIGAERSSRTLQVHRVSYEMHKGAIPRGLHIDHLCGNRRCVRPEHLEAVTQAENNRRANAKRFAAMTHCKRGHEFTEENTMRARDGKYRQCRACHNLHNRAQRRGVTINEYMEGGPDSRPVVVLDPTRVDAS